ncbi:MAG: hypothetical protein Q9209_003755 [Squamulea sp. 1 TL-2023]
MLQRQANAYTAQHVGTKNFKYKFHRKWIDNIRYDYIIAGDLKNLHGLITLVEESSQAARQFNNATLDEYLAKLYGKMEDVFSELCELIRETDDEGESPEDSLDAQDGSVEDDGSNTDSERDSMEDESSNYEDNSDEGSEEAESEHEGSADEETENQRNDDDDSEDDTNDSKSID